MPLVELHCSTLPWDAWGMLLLELMFLEIISLGFTNHFGLLTLQILL